MNFLSILLLLIAFFALPNNHLFAKEAISPGRADSHAPIKVMGDHTHKQGEIMFSYRYMTMGMDGYQSGSSSSNYTEARKKPLGGHYMTVPEEMTINMHMIDAMYGALDDLTFMVMGSCIDNEMKIINLYQYIYSNYYGDGVRVYNLQ